MVEKAYAFPVTKSRKSPTLSFRVPLSVAEPLFKHAFTLGVTPHELAKRLVIEAVTDQRHEQMLAAVGERSDLQMAALERQMAAIEEIRLDLDALLRERQQESVRPKSLTPGEGELSEDDVASIFETRPGR